VTDKDWALDLYSLFARGGDDERLYYVEIEGDPWSKSRPRFARGRTYQKRDDLEAEQRLKARLLDAGASSFPGNVMLVCRFYRSNFQRIDADNLLKHVCDSANGVLWTDDSQVTLTLAEVHYDAERPRTIILAGNHRSTLTRGEDAKRPCAHCGELFMPAAGRRRDAQRYCGSPCSRRARGHDLSEPVPCKQCEKPFRRTTKAQTMCSRECRADSLRGRNRSRGVPRSVCPDCGKTLSHSRGGRCRKCWKANPVEVPGA
jgi:Holliday junction resolvase RusA-like endonuclease